MRDPNRINDVLQALRAAWKAHPDLRLGQLVLIAAGQEDAFELEEDAWLQALRALADHPSTEGDGEATARLGNPGHVDRVRAALPAEEWLVVEIEGRERSLLLPWRYLPKLAGASREARQDVHAVDDGTFLEWPALRLRLPLRQLVSEALDRPDPTEPFWGEGE